MVFTSLFAVCHYALLDPVTPLSICVESRINHCGYFTATSLGSSDVRLASKSLFPWGVHLNLRIHCGIESCIVSSPFSLCPQVRFSTHNTEPEIGSCRVADGLVSRRTSRSGPWMPSQWMSRTKLLQARPVLLAGAGMHLSQHPDPSVRRLNPLTLMTPYSARPPYP